MEKEIDDFVLKLIQEYKELYIKINKLKNYIDVNNISIDNVMRIQYKAMLTYLECLDFRLSEQSVNVDEISRNL